MAAGQLVLLCLVLTTATVLGQSQGGSSDHECRILTWPSHLGTDPVGSNEGKVVLLALMKGYCGYCIQQASRLQELREHLATQGMPNISMTIINGGEDISRSQVANLQTASDIPVIQDDRNHTLFTLLRGRKDDFVVFDRCGQQAAFLPSSYTYLGYSYTERVLRAVYRARHDCYCSHDNNSPYRRYTMQADAPTVLLRPGRFRHTMSHRISGLECPPGDVLCNRRMRRRMNNRHHLSRLSNRPRARPTHHNHRERGHGLNHHGQRNHQRHNFRNRHQVMRHYGLSGNGAL